MVKVWVDINLICAVEVEDKMEVKMGTLLLQSHSFLLGWAVCLESHSVLYIENFEMNICKYVFLLLVISKN